MKLLKDKVNTGYLFDLYEADVAQDASQISIIFESLSTDILTLYLFDSVESMVYIDRKIAVVALSIVLYTSVGLLFEALSDLEKRGGLKLYKFHRKKGHPPSLTCQDCNPLTVTDAGASTERLYFYSMRGFRPDVR